MRRTLLCTVLNLGLLLNVPTVTNGEIKMGKVLQTASYEVLLNTQRLPPDEQIKEEGADESETNLNDVDASTTFSLESSLDEIEGTASASATQEFMTFEFDPLDRTHLTVEVTNLVNTSATVSAPESGLSAESIAEGEFSLTLELSENFNYSFDFKTSDSGIAAFEFLRLLDSGGGEDITDPVGVIGPGTYQAISFASAEIVTAGELESVTSSAYFMLKLTPLSATPIPEPPTFFSWALIGITVSVMGGAWRRLKQSQAQSGLANEPPPAVEQGRTF